jgi:hypothetical protein
VAIVVFNSQGSSSLVTVHFPNCLKVDASGKSVLDSENYKDHLEDKRSQQCDSSHPYRIARTSYLLHFDSTVTARTLFAMGEGEYGEAGLFFHADYLAAVQDEFNYATDRDRNGRIDRRKNSEKALIDLCLNDVRNSVKVAHPRCGPEPGN